MTSPRSILITGASSGIGAALATAYAREQVTLVLMGRNEERLSRVSSVCRDKGACVVKAVHDIADTEGFLDALSELDRHWCFDLVIFNAAVGDTSAPLQQTETPQQIVRLLDINLRGPAAGASLIVERMIARGEGGAIAMISSVAAFVPLPMAAGYAASKAGLNAFALSLNAALRGHGIAVSVICPGYVDTPMSARLNTFKPFQMKPEAAAGAIIACIARKQVFAIIPFQYAVACFVLKFVPTRLAVWLSSKFSLDASPYFAAGQPKCATAGTDDFSEKLDIR
ncbi:SDR family NAD(P)-dependent oxidoreductase [Afipia clevelandensis]|nr:SDR family NAD(P)-dependent oxidoreductase [Afipia clevelandensis]